LSGELDMTSRESLADILRAEIDRPAVAAICVDLNEVTFIDSTGLQVLIRAQIDATTAGRRLIVTGAQGAPLRVLRLSGLLEILTHSPIPPPSSPETSPSPDSQAS